MGDVTKIEWTDHTFNPWIGCSRISAGCDNCYAEALATRYGLAKWGPAETRKRTSTHNWKNPLKWNRAAEKKGRPAKVFCASLSDVFDKKAPENAREDLFDLIRVTPHLEWQLLSKRPENMEKYLPGDWGNGYPNVWLGVTAEDQSAYDQRWPIISRTPAKLRFISYEPAIGPLSLNGFPETPDWIIWGGESGRGARAMDWKWALNVTEECQRSNIPVFGKQWGTYPSNPIVQKGEPVWKAQLEDPPENGKGGALLPSRSGLEEAKLWRQFPN